MLIFFEKLKKNVCVYITYLFLDFSIIILLFDEIIRIAKLKQPKFMFLENVKHIMNRNFSKQQQNQMLYFVFN